MTLRPFGHSDLRVSEIGFGAWAIGGPARVGDVAIGWGETDDKESLSALNKAFDRGINFYDTADFYGLGHSEKLIGEAFGNSDKVIIATKVGHRAMPDDTIALDYSKEHILNACDESLKRLKREQIDYYQLHSAKLKHLLEGGCVEAMEQLKKQGKIRYWGLSLNTYDPFPEAEYMMDHRLGDGFQLVFNVINQRACGLFNKAQKKGYGIIARMPLQFGLLTGKFDDGAQFDKDDHRYFRLKPHVLKRAVKDLAPFRDFAGELGVSQTDLAFAYILAFDAVSTVIPGIRTVKQAQQNSDIAIKLNEGRRDNFRQKWQSHFENLLQFIEREENA